MQRVVATRALQALNTRVQTGSLAVRAAAMSSSVLQGRGAGGGGAVLATARSTAVPALFTQARSFGIADKVMGMATGAVEGRRDEQFSLMLKLMGDSPKWTLGNWKQTMDNQLNSWTQYIPGVSGSDEMKELKGFQDMLDCMTPQELEDPKLIKHPQKERIARSSGKGLEAVQKLLHYYSQSCIIAEWLRVKKKGNEKLPTTEDELNQMQATDPRMKTIAAKVRSTVSLFACLYLYVSLFASFPLCISRSN